MTAVADPPVAITPPPRMKAEINGAPQILAEENAIRLPGFSEPVTLRRFSAEEYGKLIDVGVLTDEDSVELLDGYVVCKMARNSAHDFGVDQLQEYFFRAMLKAWFVKGQTAIRFPGNQPEPDLTIVRGSRGDFRKQHPTAKDIALIAEVADSSLARDRNDKGRIYANVGIPQYWIVNIVERQVEVYTDPTGPGDDASYRNRKDYPEDASVPVVLDGTPIGSIAVSDLLA